MAEGGGGEKRSEGLVDLSSGGDETKFFIRGDEEPIIHLPGGKRQSAESEGTLRDAGARGGVRRAEYFEGIEKIAEQLDGGGLRFLVRHRFVLLVTG